MKFRAKLLEAGSMRQFSNIITTLSKLAKNCVLRICADRLYFIVPEEHSIPYKISVWCILHKNEFFNAYEMVGDTDKNEIYLNFNSDMLAASCGSIRGGGSSVVSLKIKLTHKVSPCITLELELASSNSNSQMCIYDVPVTLVSKQDWVDYQEPEIDNFNISTQMPNTRVLKNIVDKLKKINNKVIINATTDGALSLLVKATTATIETHFKDLNVQSSNTSDSASVCVDIRKLSQFLTCDAINPSTMVCNIVTNHMLNLCLSHTGFQLKYYLLGIDE
ncbi:checkpoint protein HUS1 isoform X2 [Planococcus citri]|uniref:checkpoint protein HUS1 isoform X2 n=1 Tax=Planococcus citri TaxID=170843 RepID=UPI0031F7A6AA